MVRLIVGPAGSGKTHRIREMIAHTVKNDGMRALLIVPDQYTFENERALYDTLGAMGALGVEVLNLRKIQYAFLQLLRFFAFCLDWARLPA